LLANMHRAGLKDLRVRIIWGAAPQRRRAE